MPSIGHWDKDTLVVESNGFNDKSWLDEAGHPQSEDLHVTERFHRVDFGHVQFEITFDDPKVLVKALTRSITVDYAPDTEMLEYVCNEGERDAVHYVGRTAAGPRLSADVLGKYAGTYEAQSGGKVTVRVVDGQLYMNAFPLVPESDTRFESADSDIEFFVSPTGSVTHLVSSGVEGDVRFDRKQ